MKSDCSGWRAGRARRGGVVTKAQPLMIVVPDEATVTADAVNGKKKGAIFPVTLILAKSAIKVDGTPIRLRPGMNLTAEVKTGKRRVIEYLLSPVRRAAN